MSAEWRKFNLGDLTDWSSGGTPSKKNTEFWIGTIPWISASSMRSTRYSESELKITPEGLKSGSRLAPMGSILLLVRGSILHQKIPVGITTRDVAFNQDVKAIQIKRHLVDSEVIDNWYLFYWFKANEKLLLSIVESTGIGAGKLDTKQLQGLEVDVPSWGEQQQIVACCKAIEEKEIINAQINQTLEQIAQAIFKSWFVDFEPVKAKIAALEASGSQDDALLAAMQVISGKDPQQLTQLQTESPEHYTTLRATAELFPAGMQESELGEIPEGWEASTVGAEFDVTMGQSPPGSSYNESGEGSVFFQGRRDFGVRFPSNRVYCTEPKRMAKQGDTLLSVRAPVGDVNIASAGCCIGRGLAAIRHKTGCSSFTYYSVIHLGHALASYDSEGTVFGSINQKNLNSLLVIAPTKKALEIFSNIVGKLDDRIKAQSNEMLALAELRDTLLPKLLSGELSVNQDVE